MTSIRNRIQRSFWPLAITVTALCPTYAQQANAEGLRTLIRDLYGGDGITLPTQFHEAHFTSFSLRELDDLSDDVARGVTAAPFGSSSTSIIFDIEQGIPVRAQDSLGPILSNRATTIGQNRVSFGVSYTRIDYDRFEGDNLNNLQARFVHDDCCSTTEPPFGEPDGVLGPPGPGFELDEILVELDLEIEQEIFAIFGTYGVTDSWDIGVVVPIIDIEGSVNAEATIIDNGGGGIHSFEPQTPESDSPTSSNRADGNGIGDLIMRTKYQFLDAPEDDQMPDLAVVGQVTLPTGDEDDLLGTGETGVLGALAASKQFGAFAAHASAGYELYSGDIEDNLRYSLGGEYMPFPSVTTVAEIIGRYEPDGDGPGDTIDGLIGVKWQPGMNDYVITANALLPINRDTGLRSDFIFGIGLELAF